MSGAEEESHGDLDPIEENKRLRQIIEEYEEDFQKMERDNLLLKRDLDEMRDMRNSFHNGEDGRVAVEVRFLESEKERLLDENRLMLEDLTSFKEELDKEKEKSKNLELQLREEQKTSRDTEREMQFHKKEAAQYRKQLQAQQSSIQQKEEEHSSINTRLQDKNREVEKYLNEITLLANRNKELEAEVQNLGEELEVAVREAEM